MFEQKKSNLIFAIIVIVLCALSAIIFIYDRNKTQNFTNQFNDNTNEVVKTEKNEETEQKKTDDNKSKKEDTKIDTIPTLYCVGDSTTLGIEDQNNSYPAFINESANFNIKLIGDKKITSAGLLVKLGVTPVYVDKLTIPATTTPTPIVFLNQGGKANNELLKSQGSIDSVTINGINGKITYRYEGNTLLFTRDQPGEQSIVNSPTLIQVNNNIEPGGILVLYSGAYEQSVKGSLVEYQKQIISAFNTDKYIVVSLTQDDRNETNAALKSAHGEHYLDFKSYLLSNGLQDAGITATQQDQQNISESKIPVSLRANDINGNDKYSELLSKQILNKLIDLKYINKNILK